jgi:ectoine hydroxylase-related dioxygenase (phytanoyl-CoA dioxygenase family)
VELDTTKDIAPQLKENAQTFPLRAGNLVSWDSRTTHANSENVSGDTRYVAYVAAGPTREEDDKLINVRMEGFTSGEGSNVREALMHASKKSRYSDLEKLQSLRKPEELNLLGQLLYGQEKYAKIIN